MKKCDRAISLSHFLKSREARGVCEENKENKKKRLADQKIFDGRKEFIRLRQNNGANELSDVRDMDSTVNKGTNSRVTSEQG